MRLGLQMWLAILVPPVAVAVAYGAQALSGQGLDAAQKALEDSPDLARSHGYNWPVFKQANSWAKLSCKDSADGTLRTCVIRMQTVDPLTGEKSAGLSIVDSFACSVATCEWIGK